MARPADLSPTPLQRLAELRYIVWLRTPLARKIAAGALAALGVVLMLRDDPDRAIARVVVAARDLQPGRVLTADDLTLAEHARNALPDGALTSTADVVGHTVAGPARAGETLTDVRILGPRLAVAATGRDDGRLVPVQLAEAAVTELLRSGDRVDVLSAPHSADAAGQARVIAADAVVVLVSAPDSARSKEKVVLLAMPTAAAEKVAAASLTDALTVTFH
ncbi:flagellar biosynthesis protein FlgA [Skermania sp. ID1734]|uniref:SAF domain-containing protein n=1 Tax=Skermania sp. ID1734 TaxID=2597516 RepID=UPI001181344C|nr:SAF domain-containing protein [Skermania sp. ID1734]TSD99704.1 flagellar biosynthesis protein FlgA [Skermania sp. ID1734]